MIIDPYVLLNLTDDVDDATVKAAYLAAIQAYPPEQNPEMFEAIRIAYETIATERQRLKYHLFNSTPIDASTILHACLEGHTPETISDQPLRQMLAANALSLIRKNLDHL